MPGWKLTRRQKSQIRAKHGRGWDLVRLAHAYGVTVRAIYDILGRSREVPRISEEEIRSIQALRDIHTQRETSAQSGRSRATIQRLERDGIIRAPAKIPTREAAWKRIRRMPLRIPRDGEIRD